MPYLLSSLQLIPRFQRQPFCPVLAKLLDFLLFQHTEGFAREILAVDFFGINAERRAQFVADETVEMGVAGVPLSAEVGANRENKNLPSL